MVRRPRLRSGWIFRTSCGQAQNLKTGFEFWRCGSHVRKNTVCSNNFSLKRRLRSVRRYRARNQLPGALWETVGPVPTGWGMEEFPTLVRRRAEGTHDAQTFATVGISSVGLYSKIHMVGSCFIWAAAPRVGVYLVLCMYLVLSFAQHFFFLMILSFAYIYIYLVCRIFFAQQ